MSEVYRIFFVLEIESLLGAYGVIAKPFGDALVCVLSLPFCQ